jgi:hypothetical protein
MSKDVKMFIQNLKNSCHARRMEINPITGKLSERIQVPAVRLNPASTSTKVQLVSAIRLSFVKRFMGLPSQRRSTWAVLIGIDDYKGSRLQCVVADAVSMSDFLTNQLAVPPDHITTRLLGWCGADASSPSYPTRKNILSSLWSLHEDEHIQHGDMIVIFYSGHGSTYSSNGFRFEKDERKVIDLEGLQEILRPRGPVIDAIVPIDRDEEDWDPGYVGTKVPDICDRELNAIFNLTRRKKGPNIVFIADCCYSASISRNAGALWKERALPPFGGDLLREMLSRG